MDDSRRPGLVRLCGFNLGSFLLFYIGARWRNSSRVVRAQTGWNGPSVMVVRASVVLVHPIDISINNPCRAQRKRLTPDLSWLAADL